MGNIQQVALIGTRRFLGALAVFLLAAMFPHVTARHRVTGSSTGLSRERLREKITGIMHKFLDGLASLRSPFNVLMVFFTSVIIWLLETGKYWFVMHAFNFSVSFFALMLMNGIVNLATTIPSAPGYIGTFDAPRHRGADRLWRGSGHRDRIYAGAACGAVAPDHAAGRILPGARGHQVEQFAARRDGTEKLRPGYPPG